MQEGGSSREKGQRSDLPGFWAPHLDHTVGPTPQGSGTSRGQHRLALRTQGTEVDSKGRRRLLETGRGQ